MLLTEFLLRAIAQDEALALAAVSEPGFGLSARPLPATWESHLRHAGGCANLLAECEAKRHIVAAHVADAQGADGPPPGCRRCRAGVESSTARARCGSCETLRLMAVDYADRPGFNPWWEPAWLRRSLAV